MHIFLFCWRLSSGYILRNGIARSKDYTCACLCVLNTYCEILHEDYTSLHHCLFPYSLSTRCVTVVFNFCQPDRWEKVSWCSFNLYLFYYEWSETAFHMCKGHIYFIFLYIYCSYLLSILFGFDLFFSSIFMSYLSIRDISPLFVNMLQIFSPKFCLSFLCKFF